MNTIIEKLAAAPSAAQLSVVLVQGLTMIVFLCVLAFALWYGVHYPALCRAAQREAQRESRRRRRNHDERIR